MSRKVICMTFEEIEAQRQAAGISIAQLCRRADVSPTTYWRRKNGRNGASEKTLTKLWDVVRRLPPAPPVPRRA
jgi:transcriptional regulator with XRE-family HTH domain